MSKTILIIPCYNEAERLDFEALRAFAAAHPDIALLTVDDGSTDATAQMLAGHQISLLRLERNGGKAEAVRQGMLAALREPCDYVGYFDADLATPLELAARWAARFDAEPGLGMICGCRLRRLGADIRRSALRHLIGRGFATFFSLYLRLPVYDTQCGAKLFRREIAQQLFAEPFVSRWLFDVELFRRFPRERALSGIFEDPLPAWRDVGGSKLKLRHALPVFIELTKIILHYRCRVSGVAMRKSDACE
ncbi:MAG: glycosyltransferase [Victivallaceae bacterium]